jgi:hypothetical protein
MRIRISYLTPLLAAGATAAAIAAAPTAMAATAGPGCHMEGGSPVCPNTHSTLISSPPNNSSGNSQINDSVGAVPYSPQYPYAEGDYYGGGYVGGFGGFGHGGGFGGHGGGGGHGK